MQRIILVSNRLPIHVTKRKGVLTYHPSAGGLATGLGSLYKQYESVWIGWPGVASSSEEEKAEIAKKLAADNMFPVFLAKDEVEKFYEGFSNRTIWPLFHYFPQYTIYRNDLWNVYEQVNLKFRDEIVRNYQEGDIIWIHDYQLLLLPFFVRQKLPGASIGFFLHIPFPSFEIFRYLPWRSEILSGLLGADLIGFHTFDYARHFLSSVMRLLGIEHTLGKLSVDDRVVQVDSFPMGIDYDKYAEAISDIRVKRQITNFSQKISAKNVVVSIDRLDYSKGLVRRLEGYSLFLEKNPSFREKITLILLVVPSRLKVETYKHLKHQVDEMVGRINGEYGTIGWTPIWYYYRPMQFQSIAALYNIANVCLVTPFRDGMNLVAKEFIASKKDGKGVLILSEMAGAASELGEAIIINPNNVIEIANALREALAMPVDVQIKHNREMQEKLKRYNITRWLEDFIDRLNNVKNTQESMMTRRLNYSNKQTLLSAFQAGQRRLIFLDYDGTLVPFAPTPEESSPDSRLLSLLRKLNQISGVELVLISGRTKMTLSEWFSDLDINLVAEHGAWIKERGKDWETLEPLSQEWKGEIRPILELYMERTPGSLIEDKEFSLVWHYRKADVGLGEMRARELADTLSYLTSNLNLQILEGNKVIEVKSSGVNKGRAALHFVCKSPWDFILAIGDDWTDEDMFKAMPESAFTIKVGLTTSSARHSLKSYKEVRNLLKELIEREEDEKGK